jgi:hypothetical protein
MATSPEKWEAVKVLFEAAQEFSPEDVAAFLRAGSSDPEVRAEVGRLLAEYHQAGAPFFPIQR